MGHRGAFTVDVFSSRVKNDDIYNWKHFTTRIKTTSPKLVMEASSCAVPQVFTNARKFANVSDENLFDVFDIFNQDQIQYIRDFDI